ncbi:short chain dehydrogenase/reductase family oxidoreductase [Klebsiella variicola]|uniref:Short chain dehydrogenase/reductase family oxidoreductase n=1 Tax=Klebsiella variicola TaxID=244366 RepID=A0A7H4MHX1_KLEVA|nr:short chain dehydrogenase/reductase family oxidoreductase [Klebsiella variicola]
MNLQIQQRVALVCGAGSGLGQAIACSLAQEGVKVAVTGRNREKLAQTVERITQLGGTARAWPLDFAVRNSLIRSSPISASTGATSIFWSIIPVAHRPRWHRDGRRRLATAIFSDGRLVNPAHR